MYLKVLMCTISATILSCVLQTTRLTCNKVTENIESRVSGVVWKTHNTVEALVVQSSLIRRDWKDPKYRYSIASHSKVV